MIAFASKSGKKSKIWGLRLINNKPQINDVNIMWLLGFFFSNKNIHDHS